MKTGQWTLVMLGFALLCLFTGYKVSAKSGTEPGYFEAVEAAGYGGTTEAIEGISAEMADYYKSLTEED
jgi:hypothetical protein